MKIKILFSYVENEIPHRCRLARPVRYHDGEIELDIPEIESNEAPVAIRSNGKTNIDDTPFQLEYNWWKNRLWTNVESDGIEPCFDKETKVPTHFLQYPSTLDLRSDSRLENFDFGIYLANASSSKQQAINYLKEWSSDQLIIDGNRYQPTGEPRYVVMTFGLGRNHGATACMMDARKNPNIGDSAYFNLLERDKAIERATEVAMNRGDSKSLPIAPHGPSWEVLIPEAIRLNIPIKKRKSLSF